jgi:hypothetical protein
VDSDSSDTALSAASRELFGQTPSDELFGRGTELVAVVKTAADSGDETLTCAICGARVRTGRSASIEDVFSAAKRHLLHWHRAALPLFFEFETTSPSSDRSLRLVWIVRAEPRLDRE